MEPRYKVSLEGATLHISTENSKLGAIHNFSTLPGDKDHLLTLNDGTLLTDVIGTCSGMCSACFSDCYARNAVKRYAKTLVKNWGENTLLLKAGVLFAMLREYFKSHQDIDLFRVHTSGELRSAQDIAEWNKIAKENPKIHFGCYTKNIQALEEFMATGETIADNFCINISQWKHICDPFLAKYPGQFNVFEYDPTELPGGRDGMSDDEIRRYQKGFKCPAVTAEGHHRPSITCSKCGRCYGKCGKGLHTMVYAH